LPKAAIVIAEPAQANSNSPQQRTTSRIPARNPDQYSRHGFDASDWPIEFTSLDSGKFGAHNPERSLCELCTIAAHAGAMPASNSYHASHPLRVLCPFA